MKSALGLMVVVLGVCLVAWQGALPQDAPKPASGLEAKVDALSTRVDEVSRRLEKVELTLTVGPSGQTRQPSETKAISTDLITVTITKKEFSPSDVKSGQYKDYILFSAKFTGAGLRKKTRSIKGGVQFCDLFGEIKYAAGLTINQALEPNSSVEETGLSIDYNQFKDTHIWLRATALADMTFKFKVSSILYADGTRDDFE